MKIVTFLSNIAMPSIILLIIIYGLIEKNKVFDTFLDGAKEGLEIVFNIFPTLVGLFVAIGVLRSCGIIDIMVKILQPVLNIINFPGEIMPLALLRPISGSSSIAVATDIMKNYGVDSNIGFIASIIMGSTETTLYTIAVYSGSVGIKKTRFVLIAALIADIVGMLVSVIVRTLVFVRSVKLKNIFKITFVIIGTLIGAGFASGQEMYIFFYAYGTKGLIGLLVSSVLIGMVVYKTLKIMNKNKITNYNDYINFIIKKNYKKKYFNLKNIFIIIINIFILITFFIMIAGFGAYFEQSFGINHFLGSIILAILCFIVFKSSVKGLVKVNQILIPILIILISIIGVLNFTKINISSTIMKISQFDSPGWLISALLYSSYNSILLIPTIITLKNYLKNKKSILIISTLSTAIIMLLSVLLFFILGGINNNLDNIEMPIVYAIENMFKGLTLIYGFVIVSSIFTTSISLGTSFLQNVANNKKCYTQIAAIMCITSVVVSNFGFSNLVNLLYPIFGYLGLIQIFIMFCR